MQHRITILCLLIYLSMHLQAQTFQGKVFGITDTLKEPIAHAVVSWVNTSIAVQTDSLGRFEISLKDVAEKKLIVNADGFFSDTLSVYDTGFQIIYLKADVTQLKAVMLRDRYMNVIKTEVINKDEIKKSACCDLAGCFETQATVQPMTTNIITNSKELRILGLSGVYNQVLVDGMPLVQGLSYTYGISGIPGTLLNNIYVAKGANSVLQGYESIAGSINVVLKEPDQTERFFFNAYMNSFWEKHLNANVSKRWKKWSTLAAFHMVQPASKFDRDQDTFLDVPKLTRYMGYNKWKYRDEDSLGMSSMIGLRYLNEHRLGGQVNFTESQKGSTTVYGQSVSINQPELYTKSGFRFDENRKITLIASSFLQDQNSYFGTIRYKAQQYNAYANVQYELKWNYNHELKTGMSLRHVNLEENISFSSGDITNRTYRGRHLKNETIPGIFAENVFKWRGDRIAWITGARLDRHNQFGFFFTPRTQFKYELREGTIARLSAGTGWRTINLFSENINLLASSRDVIVKEQLKPEQAFNWGLNLGQDVDFENVSGVLSLDLYKTRFMNQIFPDYDSDPLKAYIANYTGTSISNAFQVESNLKFYKRFTAKLAYTFLDVFRVENGIKNTLPFNSKHKVMGSFSYMPLSKAWHVDANVHWYGVQRLPSTLSNPSELQRPSQSSAYTIVSAQFTKVWKKVEVYAGCENIFDFRQLRPISGWQDPFSPYFDSSFAWGPTRGRELYAGIRYFIK